MKGPKKEPLEVDDDEDRRIRASTLKSPYLLKSDDPKEAMRIKSLQLLNFKLATHKEEIVEMLQRHLSPTSHLIPLKNFQPVMLEFTSLTKVIFMLYD